MNVSQPRLLGVVLCGGASKRMGRDKCDLAAPGGMSFLEYAYQRLLYHCDAVCISAPQDKDVRFHHVPDPPQSHGPISGIHASLTYAANNGFQACVFNPVDTPLLMPADIELLVSTYREHRDRIICALSDNGHGDLEPLISVFPVETCHVIGDWIDQGHYSVRRFLSTQIVTTVSLPSDACRNINTPSQWNDLQHER